MPRSKEKVLYYKRAFLNRPRRHSGAFIIAEVCEDRWSIKDPKKEVIRLGTTLEISDCDRHISLTLDTGSRRGDRRNTLYKLNLLITTLTEVRDVLQKWFDENPKSADY